MNTVYRVYWSEETTRDDVAVQFANYEAHQMSKALRFTEVLRERRRNGERIDHIVMSCENPDSVGQQGVDVTGPEYDWKKRRI